MSNQNDPVQLKSELVGLFQYIQRVKEEIAAINRPADSEHQFESMSEQTIRHRQSHPSMRPTPLWKRSKAVTLRSMNLRAEIKGNAKAEALL